MDIRSVKHEMKRLNFLIDIRREAIKRMMKKCTKKMKTTIALIYEGQNEIDEFKKTVKSGLFNKFYEEFNPEKHKRISCKSKRNLLARLKKPFLMKNKFKTKRKEIKRTIKKKNKRMRDEKIFWPNSFFGSQNPNKKNKNKTVDSDLFDNFYEEFNPRNFERISYKSKRNLFVQLNRFFLMKNKFRIMKKKINITINNNGRLMHKKIFSSLMTHMIDKFKLYFLYNFYFFFFMFRSFLQDYCGGLKKSFNGSYAIVAQSHPIGIINEKCRNCDEIVRQIEFIIIFLTTDGICRKTKDTNTKNMFKSGYFLTKDGICRKTKYQNYFSSKIFFCVSCFIEPYNFYFKNKFLFMFSIKKNKLYFRLFILNLYKLKIIDINYLKFETAEFFNCHVIILNDIKYIIYWDPGGLTFFISLEVNFFKSIVFFLFEIYSQLFLFFKFLNNCKKNDFFDFVFNFIFFKSVKLTEQSFCTFVRRAVCFPFFLDLKININLYNNFYLQKIKNLENKNIWFSIYIYFLYLFIYYLFCFY